MAGFIAPEVVEANFGQKAATDCMSGEAEGLDFPCRTTIILQIFIH